MNSSISAPFMEAFLEIQRQLHQFIAFIDTGVANSKQLTAAQREDLVIFVRVTGGSSNLEAKLGDALKKAIPTMLRKLSAKQVTTIILSMAVLLGAAWAYSAWLEVRRQVQLEELKSKEHLAASDDQ